MLVLKLTLCCSQFINTTCGPIHNLRHRFVTVPPVIGNHSTVAITDSQSPMDNPAAILIRLAGIISTSLASPAIHIIGFMQLCTPKLSIKPHCKPEKHIIQHYLDILFTLLFEHLPFSRHSITHYLLPTIIPAINCQPSYRKVFLEAS